MPERIELSLVSHTNVGKTTLARTLLGRDIGEIRDEAHVTMQADRHLLVSTAQGDELALWDTPGFGDSHRLASRLAKAENPLGWFLTQVWDRYRERALFASQQAVRNVREKSDVVLYLVNASEDPVDTAYVDPEMRILQWIGKPVIVLLNQIGRPQTRQQELADIERWRARVAKVDCVRGVIALDAFARCWVQEGALLAQVEAALAPQRRDALARLRSEWLRTRRRTYEESVAVLAARLTRAACDGEPVEDSGWNTRLREFAKAIGLRADGDESPRQVAMSRLAQRLDADIRDTTDKLIALHGLGGHASGEILARLAEHYAIRERLSEGKAAAVGGIVTGALAGLKADLASGGLTFGAGLLVGGVLGALGAAGLAHGYNLVRGAGVTMVTWTDEVLTRLASAALLGYLAVAHYGRGRGDWAASESPAHWQDAVNAILQEYAEAWLRVWGRRTIGQPEKIDAAIHETLAECADALMLTLYPDADLAAGAPPSNPADTRAGKR